MIQRLKRLLRPFEPVLSPIWRRMLAVGRARQQRATRAERRAAEASDAARRASGEPDPPIRALRPYEIAELGAAIPYYRARTGYLGITAGIARTLIERDGLTTALELGPNRQPLILGADVMDIRLQPDLNTTGRQISADATAVPWPVPDKAYDLFVALQVFEHLGTRQADAFREVRRVARNAILSLPIDWDMADPRNCHHQLRHDKVLAWFAPVVPTRVVEGNGGRRTRLIYVFEGLQAPDPAAAPDDTAPPSAIATTD
jgi:hypothetical protein